MPEPPQTLEGWWVLHDFRRVDWRAWRRLPPGEQDAVLAEARGLWERLAAPSEGGASALYAVLTHKADLAFLHFRPSADDLLTVEREVASLALADVLPPAYGYLSVIELSRHGGFGPDAATNPTVLRRLRPPIPDRTYLCFYPMSKRRGEQVNWYTLDASARQELMRSHGQVGSRYGDQVVQIISGSQGLDDWEWGVDLFADDPLVFKKLVYEMRFDPASALYAEFGPFFVGRRLALAELEAYLRGRGQA